MSCIEDAPSIFVMICRKTLAMETKSIMNCILRKICVLSLMLDRTNLTELGSICENGTIMRSILEEQKMRLFTSQIESGNALGAEKLWRSLCRQIAAVFIIGTGKNDSIKKTD